VAVAYENRSRDLSLHRRHKAHRSRVQVEDANVALQFKIGDANRLGSERQLAELLVRRVGFSVCAICEVVKGKS
jgi:hypothetical protein